ncbi:uncharacterized protein TNCV_3301321 [Trichonephila clavipes]|nr:uncharacterized protein TNCV_3301321 [Trichonephila clavipes]
MSDIEMDPTPPSPALSYKAYEELISRPAKPKPPEPTTACGKRRLAMTRLKNQETMIECYQKFLATFDKKKDEHGVYSQLQESLKETIEARDSLVSELRTMPPCLDQNFPDHIALVAKNKDLNETKSYKTKVDVNNPPEKKRENTKNNADDFVFSSKTARPTTPTPVLEPITVQNSFVNLDQDPDIPVDNTAEISIIKPSLPVF